MFKNLDLTRDSPNKISLHFLWVKMLPKNLPKIFRWPEITAFTKIWGGEPYRWRRLSSREVILKHSHSMHGGDCDAAIAKAANAVTHVQSQSQEFGSGSEVLGLLFYLSSAETDFWWLEDEQ